MRRCSCSCCARRGDRRRRRGGGERTDSARDGAALRSMLRSAAEEVKPDCTGTTHRDERCHDSLRCAGRRAGTLPNLTDLTAVARNAASLPFGSSSRLALRWRNSVNSAVVHILGLEDIAFWSDGNHENREAVDGCVWRNMLHFRVRSRVSLDRVERLLGLTIRSIARPWLRRPDPPS